MDNWYGIGLDNTELQRDVERAKALLNSIGNSAISEGSRVDSAFNGIGKSIAGYLSVAAVAGFVKEVANVRGEFEKLEISFTTMLGSKDRSSQLMRQMVDTAAKTPFTLQEVASGAKQLLAYQVAQKDVNETLIKLGNISAGLGVPLERLIMVYGQVRAKGKLMGDDLRQFTEAGVPMIAELAKSMGKAQSEVQGLISKGKVGFPEVQKVVENLTKSGGMFYNLMEEQSKSISGQISNMEDAWSRMLNSIGESNSGVMSSAVQGATSLINNYEEVGKTIAEIIAIYGAYKAAMIAISVSQAVNMGLTAKEILLNFGKTTSLVSMSATEKVATVNSITYATAQEAGAVATLEATTANNALNASLLTNPYVLIAGAVIALGYSIYKLCTYETEAEKASNKLKDSFSEMQSEIAKERIMIDTLFATLKSTKKGTEEYDQAKQAIISKYGQYLKGLGDEKHALDNLDLAYNTLTASIEKNARAKFYQKSIEDAGADFGENYKKGIEKLKEEIESTYGEGSKESIDVFVKFKSKIDKGDFNFSAQDLSPFNKTTAVYGKETKSSGAASTYNVVRSRIDDLKKASDLFKKTMKDAGLMYGDAAVETSSVSKWISGIGDLTDKQISSALNKAKKTNELISEFRKNNPNSKKTIAEFDNIWINSDESTQIQSALKAEQERRKKESKNTSTTPTESEIEKQNEAAKKLSNSKKKQALEQRQNEIDNQKALLATIEDGFAKEKKSIDLNHSQKLLDIDKKAQELLEKQQEADKLAWEKSGKKGKLSYSTALSSENQSEIDGDKKIEDIIWNTNISNQIKSIENKYQSFDHKRREIDKKYNEEYSALYDALSNTDGKRTVSEINLAKSAIDELSKQRLQSTKEIDQQEADYAMQHSDLFVQLFDDMSSRSVNDLRSIAEKAQELFDYLISTSSEDITPHFGLSAEELISIKNGKKEMKDISDQIKNLNNQADDLETGFAKVGTAIKNIFSGVDQIKLGKDKVAQAKKDILDAQASIDSGNPILEKAGKIKLNASKKDLAIGNKDQLDGLAKEKAGIDALNSSFQSVSFFAGQATSLLNAMSTEEGDAADAAAKSIGAVMDVAGSTLQGFQQGGYIGAAVAFTMSVATKVFQAEKAHQEALKKLKQESIAQQKEYNDLLIENNRLIKESSTAFGVSEFQKALGYAQQLSQYSNILFSKESTTRSAGGFLGKLFDIKITEYKGAIAALNNATVQTGSHKTGLFGWGGEKADYSSLLGTYKGLVDENGKLNQELAKSILNNQTLTKESKDALQAALDYSEKYDEALKGMSDYLTGIFGGLGNEMMKAVTDNLGNTKNALDDFADDAAGTIEKLMENVAYSLFFQDKFKAMSDQMLTIQKNTGLTPQQIAAQQEALMANFYQNIGSEIDAANKFLQDSKDAAAKSGFDLWKETKRQATQKGIAALSQDSVDENNGRLTYIQGGVSGILDGMKILQDNSSQALKHLAGIETNTARLEGIENGINSVKQGISDINTKGIYLKS